LLFSPPKFKTQNSKRKKKMKTFQLILVLIVCLVAVIAQTEAKNGGICMGCTMLVHITEQIAIKRGFKIADALNYWCDALGGQSDKWIIDVCKYAFGSFGAQVQTDFDAGRTPDYTCQTTLKMCDDDKCRLFAPNQADLLAPQRDFSLKTSPRAESYAHFIFESQFQSQYSDEAASILDFIFSSVTGWSKPNGIKKLSDYQSLLKYSNSAAKSTQKFGKGPVKPAHDEDGDGSSTFMQLRGVSWRGKDCNDQDATIYPSRKNPSGKSANIDHDCNGIYGTNPKTGKSWEEELCSGVPRFEFVQIGDSATAGFTLPPAWLAPDLITKGSYDNLVEVILNEADFPECAAVTGWNATACPSLFTDVTPFISVYDYARKQNPCLHRAYHNIGINGADAVSMGMAGDSSQILSFTRDQKNDHPAAVFIALIGNDVCGSSSDVSTYTTPENFEKAWINTLDYLDTQLPPGSHVFAGGLVDGRLLYDVMHNLVHPMGVVKYRAFYDFLNCFETSPCSGWLNSNQAIRDRTTEHAQKLNAKLKALTLNKKYKNFKVMYNDYEAQITRIINWAKNKGHDLSKFIAAVDSFHPSSTLFSKLAESFINNIVFSQSSEIFTPNPNAAKIFEMFGDLGGY
jgi:acyloxyacyl hydrolase